MKKSIFKLMSAAVALAALTSCSDDLGLGSGAKINSNADLVATLTTDDADRAYTRMGMLERKGDNPWASKSAAGWNWVFTEGDVVRVFTMESMRYQKYDLIAGENTAEGEFAIEANQPELPDYAQKYAITDAQFAYGVSPMEDGTPRVTYTIPYKYKAQTFATDEEGVDVQKLPAPFWGQAVTEDKDGTNGGKILKTNLWALTAFLRINTETLPEGTKYIVLTTHGSVMKGDTGNEYDGFQLLTPDPDDLTKVKTGNGSNTFADNLNFWDTNAQKITDGNSEPISGTFNALLTDKNSALGVDKGINEEGEEDEKGLSRLVTRDEIVIDVTTLNNTGVFWIPIIPQHYNNLHVLAVTQKSKYTYKYVGTELKVYNDWTPKVAKRYHLDLNLVNLGEVCAHDLNKAIKEVNKANKFKLTAQNIINVDNLKDCDDFTNNVCDHLDLADYPNDQILVQGEGDLVLNIAKISATAAVKGNNKSPVLKGVNVVDNTLFVSDMNYANTTSYTYADYAAAGAVSTNSVKINVPVDFASDTDPHAILADLPKTNVIFAANENYLPAEQTAAKALRIDVHGAATEFVNGKEVREVVDGKAVLKESDVAAITVESGFGSLNVLADTKGDVYVNGAADAQKLELAKGLFVYTNAGLNVRLDNALVKNVGFLASSNNHENYLITIGSTAVQKVGVAKTLGEADVETDAIPNDVSVLAYWTGYALDAEAENIKDYDNGTIYTAAQLASMGEQIGDGNDNSTQAEYKINNLLEYIWLGGETYGWVGPKVTIDDFKFDGNNVALLNMYMPANEKDAVGAGLARTIYVYDPHICCTTCGWARPTDGTERANGEDAVPMEEFGLIRSIKNAGDGDEIKNVKLNDVYANGAIGNVGSLIGTFEATTAHDLTLENNYVGEVRIDVDGDNVGGLIGNVKDAKKLKIDYNTVGNSQYETGEIKGGNYVGGVIGHAEIAEDDEADLEIIDTTVDLAKNIEADEADAAGLVGYVKAASVTLTNDQVAAKNIIATEGNNAAGFVAELIGKKAIVRAAKVDVEENIEAGDQFAAGLVAYDGAETSLIVRSSDIKANTIKSENGYVGGEVAYIPAGNVEFGYSTYTSAEQAGKHLVNNVEVETLASAYNVGGFIGNNANNATVLLAGNATNSGSSTSENSVKITKFENTKEDLGSYFKTTGSEANSHLAGTMSNVAGKVDGILQINESKLTVEDNLDGDMKKAVGYTYHNDQGATPNQSTRLFWGDSNGYVGFGKSGNYYIAQSNTFTSRDAVVGDQALNTNGFNLYKSEADYK